MTEPIRRRGLGRGLDALFVSSIQPKHASLELEPEPTAATTAPGEAVLQIDPKRIVPNPEQPRTHFDESELTALAESIKTYGLLHPIVVEPKGDGYQLVAGERRWRASQLAGMSTVPTIVRPATESARHSLELALIENLARTDLGPLEEAAAYQRLADTFGLSQDAIAQRVGKSRSAVANTIRLLNLSPPVQKALAEGSISAGHARALLALFTIDEQQHFCDLIQSKGLNVRQVEQAVAEHIRGNPPTQPQSVEQTYVRMSADDQALKHGMEEALGLPVLLQRRRKGGRVVIDFADDEQLASLYDQLGGKPL